MSVCPLVEGKKNSETPQLQKAGWPSRSGDAGAPQPGIGPGTVIRQPGIRWADKTMLMLQSLLFVLVRSRNPGLIFGYSYRGRTHASWNNFEMSSKETGIKVWPCDQSVSSSSVGLPGPRLRRRIVLSPRNRGSGIMYVFRFADGPFCSSGVFPLFPRRAEGGD
ncbi:hypothetical protein CRG98_001759 [Punica granatum]|uniref:Uncharacterized protein n=1 Tax=Punica granatum TaxID=22663 RepID=A0A2I0LAY4_PUNGR|nr:hypothetical protein CRG98_001759 [Punica granatum]